MRRAMTASSKRDEIKNNKIRKSSFDNVVNYVTFNNSNLSIGEKKQKLINMKQVHNFRKKAQSIIKGQIKWENRKTQPSKLQVPEKEQQQVAIQQMLEQIKEDKMFHRLFKNRIKRKFSLSKSHIEQSSKTENPQKIYSISQNQTLQGTPRFTYLDISSTFFSRSKKRVFDEQYQQNSTKTNFFSSPISKKPQISYLLYTSSRKHKLDFRQSKKCKTLGSSNLSLNKQKILKMSKQGTKFHNLLQNYLQEALHTN